MISPGHPARDHWNYNGFNSPLYDVAFVHCPKCEDAAIVIRRRSSDPWAKVTSIGAHCRSCTFSVRGWRWFGPVIGLVKQPCPFCGRQWLETEIKRPTGSDLGPTVQAECPGCKKANEVQVDWIAHHRPELMLDGTYGLPLVARTEVRGKSAWAYNHAHIDAIAEYVGSDQRERLHFNAMTSKLPKWMIVRKSRDGVLRALERMRDLLPPDPDKS